MFPETKFLGFLAHFIVGHFTRNTYQRFVCLLLIIFLQVFAKNINTREQKNCLYWRCQIKWFALSISLIYYNSYYLYPKKCRVSSLYAC